MTNFRLWKMHIRHQFTLFPGCPQWCHSHRISYISCQNQQFQCGITKGSGHCQTASRYYSWHSGKTGEADVRHLFKVKSFHRFILWIESVWMVWHIRYCSFFPQWPNSKWNRAPTSGRYCQVKTLYLFCSRELHINRLFYFLFLFLLITFHSKMVGRLLGCSSLIYQL